MKMKLNFIIWLCVMQCFIACRKDELKFSMPESKSVSAINNLDSLINKGKMGDWIALHGVNLNDVKQVNFNNVNVDTRDIYVKDDILYVQVPIKMPTDITNKIYVETAGGSVDFNFAVEIPNLELTKMFNEYTKPGDTIRIYGKFLDLYEVDSLNSTVSFGDKESPVISRTSTYVTAKVPNSVLPNCKVTLKNNKYNVNAICRGFYQDKNNVITSFDSDYPYDGTRSEAVGQWKNPTAISGNYMKFEVDQQSYPDGLGWYYMMENDYNYTLDMIQHPERYELKFELNMGVPIKTTKFFIYYYWAVAPQALGGEFFNVQNVNKWQTVTIPLEKIIPMGITTTDTDYSLNFRVENFAPVERLAMYFDNFRIYKKEQ